MSLELTKRYPKKRAFITGGGGGLGRSMALLLAADGWTIGITDLKQPMLDESQKLIEEKGGKAYTYSFDVSDRTAYEKAFTDFVNANDGLDVLINNAGVGDGGMFGEYSLDNWEWITGINQMAVVYGSHFATPVMKKQRSGHIISIASAAGLANMPNMSMYNVTKAAVISLMETLYAELYAADIHVSVVCPTFFRSNIMQHQKGGGQAAEVGKAIVAKAKFASDDVAAYILKQAGKKTFYILHPYQAKLVFHVRRFLPNFFLKMKAREFSKKDWVQMALKRF